MPKPRTTPSQSKSPATPTTSAGPSPTTKVRMRAAIRAQSPRRKANRPSGVYLHVTEGLADLSLLGEVGGVLPGGFVPVAEVNIDH